MSPKPGSRSRLWLYIALPFGLYVLFNVVVGGAYVLAVMSANYMEDRTLYNDSPAEARADRAFIDTVVVEPRVVRYGDYEVTFENCWLEQLRTSHRPAWDARRIVTDQPRAVFNLNYRTTYKGQPLAEKAYLADAPTLTCAQGTSGQDIGQNPQGNIAVFADVLADSGLDIELPLHLTLEGGPIRLPERRFVAYPARAKSLVYPAH